jgi:hypothetical protein
VSSYEAGQTIGHEAALGRLRTKKAQILYALEHVPRGSTVEDVRRWLHRHGQQVPTRPYAAPIVNEWRARNGVTDTGGHVPLTPELIAELEQAESGARRAAEAHGAADVEIRVHQAPAANAAAHQPAGPDIATDWPTTADTAAHRPATPANGTYQPTATTTHQPATADTAAHRPATPKTDTHQPTASTHRPAEVHQPTTANTAVHRPTAPTTGAHQPADPRLNARGLAEPHATAHRATETRRDLPQPSEVHQPAAPAQPVGAKGFYAVALLSIGVSVDTSWRFFALRLGITDAVERVVLFSVMESALVACGWAMRAGVRRDGRPGPARLVAWALTAFAAFAAISLSGPVAGAARVLLGPVLGLVMLHLALGIEIRAARRRTTTWARVGRELRERLLSLLGLGDDHRDALARTRDRAALRAAKLALASRWTPFRTSRLRKALHASHVAHDPAQRDRMLRELGVLQHARKLAETTQPSPW